MMKQQAIIDFSIQLFLDQNLTSQLFIQLFLGQNLTTQLFERTIICQKSQ